MREPKFASKYPHYYRSVHGLTHVDVYRVLQLFEVTDPNIAHAVKKLLAPGNRGAKDRSKDIREAIVTLERWEEMQEEMQEEAAIHRPKPFAEPTPIGERHPDLGPPEPELPLGRHRG